MTHAWTYETAASFWTRTRSNPEGAWDAYVSAERFLLDNMKPDVLREAVALVAGRVPLEASGGVNLDTVRAIAETGVDYISVGRITQSAPAVDIGLDYALAR